MVSANSGHRTHFASGLQLPTSRAELLLAEVLDAQPRCLRKLVHCGAHHFVEQRFAQTFNEAPWLGMAARLRGEVRAFWLTMSSRDLIERFQFKSRLGVDHNVGSTPVYGRACGQANHLQRRLEFEL